MLDSLIRLIERNRPAPGRLTRVELAAAALLVEIARLDGGISEQERVAIAAAVRDRFMLSPPAAEALVALAEKREEEVYSDWIFLDTVKRAFDAGERARLVRHLWRVAGADKVLSAKECACVERLMASLGLTPEEAAAARLGAKD